MNRRRLEHDLYWGCRLNWLRIQKCAYGFRGEAKGKLVSRMLTRARRND
jgi:hypothetical protein